MIKFVAFLGICKWLNDLNNIKKRSILLVAFQEVSFGHLKILHEKNIRLLYDYVSNLNSINNHFEYEAQPIQTPQISLQYLSYFYLQTINPRNIIYNTYYIKDFISIFLDFNSNTSCGFSKSSVKQLLFRNIDTITIDTILNDIRFLERQNILTSRLAIFIYKVCTFDCMASDKIIGEFYKEFYERSRVYNNKRYEISNIKGYLINDIQSRREYDIRLSIASNLLAHNVIDEYIISQSTGITMEELRTLK